jgi:hypothetical protein
MSTAFERIQVTQCLENSEAEEKLGLGEDHMAEILSLVRSSGNQVPTATSG